MRAVGNDKAQVLRGCYECMPLEQGKMVGGGPADVSAMLLQHGGHLLAKSACSRANVF